MMYCGARERGGLSEPEAVQKDAQRAHSVEVRSSSRGPELLRRAGDQGTRMRSERRSRREKRGKGFVSYPVGCGLNSEGESFRDFKLLAAGGAWGVDSLIF